MKKLDWIALLIVLVFFLTGTLTLQNYGLSWDEGLGNLFFGERYLRYLVTLQDKYLDFKADLAYYQNYQLDIYSSPFKIAPREFPPVADTLSAASMYITSYWLGIFDPVDGWHFFTVFLSSIFIWIFYWVSAKELGKTAGLFSLIFLASFPRFWGDMHFNPKDVPEMVFFGLVILLYYSWFKQPNLLKAIGVGILFSMALGTKLNSIFIPFILLLGIFKWEKGISDIKTNLTHFRKYSTHYLLMLMSFLITYYFSWPYIWKEPLRAISYFKYMLSQGGRGFSGTPGEALLQTITTLPEMMLIFLVIGIVFSMLNLRKESSDWNRLLLVWLMIPLIRSNLPGIANFDGIRHFLEFLPPAAMLAGWGLVKSIEYLSKIIPVKKSIIVGILISFLLLNIAEINIRYNPFQHLYYNRLIGGLQGAQQVFGLNEATDYWGVSYRKGIEWINENAPEGAGLYTAVAPHLVDITAELWLRPDINVIEESSYHSEKDQVSELYVMFITRPVFYDEIAKYCVQNLDPVYTIEVDGVDVMEIYDYE